MNCPPILRMLRAPDWWYFAILPLAALADTGIRWPRDVVPIGLALLAAAASLGFAYGVNAITDRHLDRDPRKNALVGTEHAPKGAHLTLVACVGITLGGGFAVSMHAGALAAVALVAGALYSAGPRWKRIPFLGTLTNLFIFAPLVLLAAPFPLSRSVAILFTSFVVLLIQSQLLHELADHDEDVDGGIRTTAAFLGARGIARLAVVFGPLAGVILFLIHRPLDRILTLAIMLVVAASAFLASASPDGAAERRRRHRWCSLTGGAMIFALMLARQH